MPNHVTNILRINGTPEQVTTVREAIAGVWPNEKDKDDPRPFDFNKIVPMPEGLEVESAFGEIEIARHELGKAKSDRAPRQKRGDQGVRDEVIDQIKKNIETTGYAYWYDWAPEKWGTKWNAYSQEVIEPHLISFETAWSCPVPVLTALAVKFPEVEFVCQFADEDIGSNQGTLTFRNGELVERTEAQGDDNRRMFAYKVKGLDDEEIKEREAERAEEEEEE